MPKNIKGPWSKKFENHWTRRALLGYQCRPASLSQLGLRTTQNSVSNSCCQKDSTCDQRFSDVANWDWLRYFNPDFSLDDVRNHKRKLKSRTGLPTTESKSRKADIIFLVMASSIYPSSSRCRWRTVALGWLRYQPNTGFWWHWRLRVRPMAAIGLTMAITMTITISQL